jgi:hypothetical protein
MHEQWWESPAESGAEELASIRKLRENWTILEGDGTGITTYEAPSGVYELEVGPDGTLIRLERKEDLELLFISLQLSQYDNV